MGVKSNPIFEIQVENHDNQQKKTLKAQLSASR